MLKTNIFLTDENKKCIEKAEKLNKLANDNWIIEDLFVDMYRGGGRC